MSEQQDFFEEVATRSGGKCEGFCFNDEGNFGKCSGEAAEFHRERYPRPGQQDAAKNIQHLCIKCHTKRHTCVVCNERFGEEPIKHGLCMCLECFDNLPARLVEQWVRGKK